MGTRQSGEAEIRRLNFWLRKFEEGEVSRRCGARCPQRARVIAEMQAGLTTWPACLTVLKWDDTELAANRGDPPGISLGVMAQTLPATQPTSDRWP